MAEVGHESLVQSGEDGNRPDDVVISGMSCRLPDAKDIAEFRNNLWKSEDDHTHSTCLKDQDKFDAGFFGVPPKQAHVMDPQLRNLLETTYESIVDAGIKPDSLRGSKTGVYVGLYMSDAHEAFGSNPEDPQGYAAWGCTKAMFANRISFSFDFRGPSYGLQGTDVAGSLALDTAYHSIRNGEIDAAIVAGTNLFLKNKDMFPDISDAVFVMFLQRYREARRVYATIQYSKSQISPQTSELNFASEIQQTTFLRELYTEADIEPETMQYVECGGVKGAHFVPSEVMAIQQVLCHDRDIPLRIGSVKPHIVDTMTASGLASLAKILLGFEDGMMAATIKPCPFDLDDERIYAVTMNSRAGQGLYGVNVIGQGGCHIHTVVKRNNKARLLHYIASQKLRLCIHASRTETGIHNALKFMQTHGDDMELHMLLNEMATTEPGSLPYRGYSLLNHKDQAITAQVCPSNGSRCPVWFVMSGMGSQWPGMGRTMMELEVFRHTIHECSDVLQEFGVNLHKIVMFGNEHAYDRPLHSFIGITAIQIGLIKTLRQMGVTPDGMLGHSIGEIACCYADGCLTAKEAMLTAYWRGFCVEDSNLPPGLMAAVGLTWKEAKEQCPPGVVAACHNSKQTVTISGEKDKVEQFLEELRERKVFVREVNTAGVAFHSHHMQIVGSKLKGHLNKFIEKRPRTSKWISTCIPEDQWSTDLGKHCSADYLVSNLTNPVLCQEALARVPENAIVLEIGPHALLQSILKRSLGPEAFHVGLMKRDHTDNVAHMFQSLGKCYLQGLNFNPLALFPIVSFPVTRGTPNLSPLVSWDHSQSFDLPDPLNYLSGGDGRNCQVTYEIHPGEGGRDHYLTGHVIKERRLFPAASYIQLVWKTLARYHGVLHQDCPVVFENVMIHRATILPLSGTLKFLVHVKPESGSFEIQEGAGLVCSGRVYRNEDNLHVRDNTRSTTPSCPSKKEPQLTGDEVYKELRLRGYEYRDEFRGVVESDNRGENGLIEWTGKWDTFIDSMMHISLINCPVSKLFLPTEFKSIKINPFLQRKREWQLTEDKTVVSATVDPDQNSIVAAGVSIQGADLTFTRSQVSQNVVMETVRFEPYVLETSGEKGQLQVYKEQCSRYALESLKKITEYLDTAGKFPDFKTQCVKLLDAATVDTNKATTEATVDTNSFAGIDHTGLLKYLEKLKFLPIGESFEANLTNLLEAFEADIMSDPVLVHKYDPELIKPCLDTVHENIESTSLKVLQVGPDRMDKLVTSIKQSFESCPGVELDLCTTSDKPAVGSAALKWKIGDGIPADLKPYHLIVLDSISQYNNLKHALHQLMGLLSDKGFLLINAVTNTLEIMLALQGLTLVDSSIKDKETRDVCQWLTKESWLKIFKDIGLDLVSVRPDHLHSTWFLLRKSSELPKVEEQVIIDVSNLECDWLAELKAKVASSQKKPKGDNLWLYSENQPYSGIVGLVKCLRKEPGGSRIRCIFVEDKCPNLSFTNIKQSQQFDNLVKCDLVMNVYKNGVWGSYRHVPMEIGEDSKKTTNASIQTMEKSADPVLTTNLKEPPFSIYGDFEKVTCYPRFCSVSRKDIAIATNTYMFNKSEVDCDSLWYYGMEFSGYDDKGQRVMGIVPHGAMSTQVGVERHHLWPVPDDWTLEEASTVPIAYSTAYHSLINSAQLKQDQSILVIGTSEKSLAAITLALHHGCNVFVAMDTDNRETVLEKYGFNLKPKHILDIKDDCFHHSILRQTKGEGIDIIFNPEEETLQNHFQMFKSGGHYFHSPLANKNTLAFPKGCHYMSVLSEYIQNEPSQELSCLMTQGLSGGVIKPFDTTVFDMDRVAEAFSYKDGSPRIVSIKIGDASQKGPVEVTARRKIYFEPHKCYIIAGGLGGFGLELAEWMISRGTTKLMLLSRSGIKTGYQFRKIRLWKSRGITVEVSKRNIAVLKDTREMINEAKKLGPVGGVFNLAMVLQDGLLESQTEDKYQSVCAPKVLGTKHLDDVTRTACNKTLDWFIVFSSVSSGLGNIGQSNYGYANSVMERICEQRQKDSLPGTAIQWGAIADVGVVQESGNTGNKAVGGTLPQKLVSCLEHLEQFMLHPQPVVTSFIPAKQSRDPEASDGMPCGGKPTLLDNLCKIIGIKEKRSLKKESRLVDLGLDSLMSTEIRQELERNHDMVLTAEEVRQLTIQNIYTISNEKEDVPTKSSGDEILHPLDVDAPQPSLDMASWDDLKCVVKLNDVENDKIPVYVVYGEDEKGAVERMLEKLDCPVYGIHKTSNACPLSISGLAGYLNQQLYVHNNGNKMILVGHRFGCPVAMEMGLQLEENDLDLVSHVICIEGSQCCISTSQQMYLNHERYMYLSDDENENVAIMDFVDYHLGFLDEILETLDQNEEDELTGKVDLVTTALMKDAAFTNWTKPDLRRAIFQYVLRYRMTGAYHPISRYKQDVTLIRARNTQKDIKVAGDYGLSKVIDGEISVHILNHEHGNFLQEMGTEVADIINAVVDKVTEREKKMATE